MNTAKLTTLFIVLSLSAGVALAQPAVTTGTADQRPRPRPEGRMMGGEQRDSPGAKLRIAHTIESLTEEQKSKIAEFMEARKEQFDQMRQEMREAMQKMRSATDRESRRTAMQPLRERHESARQEVDTFLKGILSAEQLQELEEKAKTMMQRGRMGRRGDDDRATTGPRPGAMGAMDGRRGAREGQRPNRKRPAGPHPSDEAVTTGTADNPFAATE